MQELELSLPATLPASPDAERDILGNVLLQGELWAIVSNSLTAAEFHGDSNQRCYCAMADMTASGLKIDLSTLQAWMTRHNTILSVGGNSYLADLTQRNPMRDMLESHISIVKDLAKVRAAIRASARIQLEGMTGSLTGDELIAEMAMQAADLAAKTSDTDFTIADDVLATLYAMDEEAASTRELLGLTLCLPDLDKSILGLRKHELMIIGGMPERAKTAFAMQIARENARLGDRVDFFSLEMGRDELMRRMMSSVSGVHPAKLRDPRMCKPEDRLQIQEAGAYIAKLPMQVHKPKGLSPAKLYAKMRLQVQRHCDELKRNDRSHLIIVDHLKAFSFCCPGGDERHKMNFAIETLRRFTDEEDVSMIVLHHLKRPMDGKINRIPTMLDLKESGDIEAAGNVILGLHREESDDGTFTGNDLILIMKMRAGEKGPINATFDTKSLEYRADYRPRDSR